MRDWLPYVGARHQSTFCATTRPLIAETCRALWFTGPIQNPRTAILPVRIQFIFCFPSNRCWHRSPTTYRPQHVPVLTSKRFAENSFCKCRSRCILCTYSRVTLICRAWSIVEVFTVWWPRALCTKFIVQNINNSAFPLLVSVYITPCPRVASVLYGLACPTLPQSIFAVSPRHKHSHQRLSRWTGRLCSTEVLRADTSTRLGQN